MAALFHSVSKTWSPKLWFFSSPRSSPLVLLGFKAWAFSFIGQQTRAKVHLYMAALCNILAYLQHFFLPCTRPCLRILHTSHTLNYSFCTAFQLPVIALKLLSLHTFLATISSLYRLTLLNSGTPLVLLLPVLPNRYTLLTCIVLSHIQSLFLLPTLLKFRPSII